MAQRIYLFIVGVVFVVAGVAALIAPERIADSLGLAAIELAGQSELRATYGGLPLGWGLVLLLGLRYRTFAIAGLAFTALGGGGLVVARFATALALGAEAFTGTVTSIILFEVAMVTFAYVLLRRTLRADDEPEVIR